MVNNSSEKRIILLGPPGAGKGTQAVLLSSHLKIPHISTGEIMRAAVSAASDLGKKVKSYLDNGSLVPDQLVIDLIKSRLSQSDCKSGFLLDGFPRTLEQAKQLDKLLADLQIALTHVIDIAVSENVLIDRIQKRGAAGSGRSDDNAEMAAKRLQVYWQQTAPVTSYYKETASVKEVDGLGTVDEVHKRIYDVVNS